MPAYAFLKRTQLRIDDLPKHLSALQKLGVPYTDEMIRNAASDAYGQAVPDSEQADAMKARYGEATDIRVFDGDTGSVTEMDALVAYLQILGRLTDTAYKPTDVTESTP
jgi:cytochrome c oxidase cbb3-type subunit 2